MQASQPDFDPPTNALHSVSPVFSLHLEDTALKTFFPFCLQEGMEGTDQHADFLHNTFGGGQEFI